MIILMLIEFDISVPEFSFDKTLLLNYNHMIFGEAPIEVDTEEEAQELMRQDERDSDLGIISSSNINLRFHLCLAVR
jgi:hypothetical protein